MAGKKISYQLSNDQTRTMRILVDLYVGIKDPKRRHWKEIAATLIGYSPATIKNIFIASEKRIPLPKNKFEQCCIKLENELKILNHTSADTYKKWKKEVNDAYDKEESKSILNNTSNIKPRIKKINSDIYQLANSHPFLKNVLENTTWYTYELENNFISKRVMKFSKINANGYCDFVLIEPGKVAPWIGDVRFIEADQFLVGICREESDDKKENHYTHFTFQVNNTASDLELCVGHKTFFSGKTKNIVTKTVILEKPTQDDPKPEFHSLNDERVKEDIRSFFYDAKKNRLSSPHASAIHNHKTFSEWIEQNQYNSRVDESIEGRYQVIYKLKPNDKNFQIDYLTIFKDIKDQLHGRYEEWVGGKFSHYWEGAIDENLSAHSLSLFMKGSFKKNNKRHLNLPLFLMITIPENGGSDIDTMTGVIAGVRTGNKGAVCRLIVITKMIDNDHCRGFNQQVIEKFFEMFKANSRVRPPNDDIVCNFDDLKNIVEE